VLEAKNKEDEKPSMVPVPDTLITGQNMAVKINRHYLIMALKYGLTEITHSIPAGQENPVLVCQSSGRKLVIALLGEPKDHEPAPSPSTNETNNERTDMPRTAATTIPPIETKTESNAGESNVKAVVQQVERIKDTLKGVINEFGDVLANLKLVEKEKKANDREIQSVRESLQEIQRIKI
jgi:hypothetical protein